MTDARALRERVIAAIKTKGPHAKAATVADAAIDLVLEEAARVADEVITRDQCVASAILALKEKQ